MYDDGSRNVDCAFSNVIREIIYVEVHLWTLIVVIIKCLSEYTCFKIQCKAYTGA